MVENLPLRNGRVPHLRAHLIAACDRHRLPGLPGLRRLHLGRRDDRQRPARADARPASRRELQPHPVRRHRQRRRAPMSTIMLLNSFVIGDDHRDRQDRDLAGLRLRHRLFPLSLPHGGVLADLPHADVAGRGAHLSDLQDRRRSRHARHLRRPDDSADRLGHRDAAVPPVLHDQSGRIAGSVQAGRGRPVPLLQGYGAAAVGDQHRGAVRDPLHLRLEPVSLAAAHHHARTTCRPSSSASRRSSPCRTR